MLLEVGRTKYETVNAVSAHYESGSRSLSGIGTHRIGPSRPLQWIFNAPTYLLPVVAITDIGAMS